MKNTDPDKKIVYYAESLVFENTLYDEIVPDTAVETMAAELFGSDWWQSQGIPVPKLSLRRLEAGNSHALVWHPLDKRDPEIRFSVCQVNAWTLAHEAAHVANDHLFDSFRNDGVYSHGAEFRSVYVTVARIVLGEEAASDLTHAFGINLGDVPGTVPVLPVDPAPEAIYPHWRNLHNIDKLRKMTLNGTPNVPRINGAIAL